jgi:hypothetical protein
VPDNVAITAGTGTTISTEEVTTLNGGAVSAQHLQRIVQAARTADGTAIDLAKAEDAAHTSGDPGVMALAVRNDAGTALAGTTGDYIPLSTDSSGNLRIAGAISLTGEDHIGEVGGSTTVIRPTITVTAGAYSANDVIGGEITLTNAMRVSSGTGILQSVTIQCADGEAPDITLLFFDSNPASNLADNAAFSWGAGDIARLLGKVEFDAADFATFGGDTIATKTGIGLTLAANGSADLYMYIHANGTPTFTATTDVTMAIGILQD